MEATNTKIIVESVDKAGNGNRVTFEQMGLDYQKLLELQGKAVMPLVANVLELIAKWHGEAEAKVKGNASPSASSAPTA